MTQDNRFVVSRLDGADFAQDGLRAFFAYRDLGMRAATDGGFGAHVIRAVRPCTDGTGRHRHSLAFQFVYVLRGEVTFWYEGQGTITLRAGDSVNQPPGILHELLRCSADCEMLEITLPAEFETAADPAAAVADQPKA